MFVLGLLTGCGMFPGASVTVFNDTSVAVEDVVVIAAEQEIWQGNLAAGASQKVPFSPPKDGSFFLTGTLASGRDLRAVEMGYTTPGAGMQHELHIQPDGSVTYTMEP